MYADSLFNAFARSFEVRSETDMSMAEYLESCRGDPMRYANAAERLLAAIGEPQMIDTAKDARLEFVARMGGARLYRASGSAARRMVYAREASRLRRRMQEWLCTSSIGA